MHRSASLIATLKRDWTFARARLQDRLNTEAERSCEEAVLSSDVAKALVA